VTGGKYIPTWDSDFSPVDTGSGESRYFGEAAIAFASQLNTLIRLRQSASTPAETISRSKTHVLGLTKNIAKGIPPCNAVQRCSTVRWDQARQLAEMSIGIVVGESD
jgi:hypothetical protein